MPVVDIRQVVQHHPVSHRSYTRHEQHRFKLLALGVKSQSLSRRHVQHTRLKVTSSVTTADPRNPNDDASLLLLLMTLVLTSSLSRLPSYLCPPHRPALKEIKTSLSWQLHRAFSVLLACSICLMFLSRPFDFFTSSSC